MIKAILEIKCWNCGNEEQIIKYLDESEFTFSADKPCPYCDNGEMMTKELTMQQDMGQTPNVVRNGV
jgi:hypothetical protein